MIKLNFATRITSRATMKSDNSASATDQRNRLQSEVNSRPVIIDRAVFVKSEYEKEELKLAKFKHKQYLKKA
jgi:hypothetical protein